MHAQGCLDDHVVTFPRVVEGNRASSPDAVRRSRRVPGLIPDLRSTGGHVLDKAEGPAIMPDGSARASTGNDAIDGNFGEAVCFPTGGT